MSKSELFSEIRRIAITAMFSDDFLMDRLVLKGGNAPHLAHGVGERFSLDVDFSISDDFEDLAEASRKIETALLDRFDSSGYTVFDFRFMPRPSNQPKNERWGGYDVEFKLLPNERRQDLANNLDRARASSLSTGPGDQRKFKIQISKYEYCGAPQEVDFDGYTIYVYRQELILVEKLRAICQQMASYPRRRAHPTPRARDFFDIHSIVASHGGAFDSEESLALYSPVFGAKEVPLELLPEIAREREFHRQGWSDVEQTVSGQLESFDFYFDFVVDGVGGLEPLWNE